MSSFEIIYRTIQQELPGGIHFCFVPNNRKMNYYIHLIFLECQLLKETVIEIMSRNMFYDEKREYIRKKKFSSKR